MCIGTSSPRPASSASMASIPLTSSQSPVKVVPTTATTPIVFSSMWGSRSSGPSVTRPFANGTCRGSTSK
jgi:hypothetical protein